MIFSSFESSLRLNGTPPHCDVSSIKMNNKIKDIFIKFSIQKLLTYCKAQIVLALTTNL